MNSPASQPTPLRMAVCLSVHRLEHLDRLAACFLTRREGGGRACHVFAAANRPATFTKTEADNTTIVECGYDYMGRRCIKKITVNGVITLHQRYIYRGYLQIACVDLTRSGQPGLWLITWDPAQPTATQPLAIQKNGTWYTYGHDLTKNVTELYNTNGTIATAYDYTPFGQVTASGTADQPIQWSSEYNDTELGLVYYNYRHYNPTDGRWINRDPIAEQGGWNLYGFVGNDGVIIWDALGLSWWSRAKQLASGVVQVVGGAVMALSGAVSANPLTAIPLIGLGLVNVFQGAGDIIEAVWPEEGNTSKDITIKSLEGFGVNTQTGKMVYQGSVLVTAFLSFRCSKKSIDIILKGRYQVSSYEKFVPGFGIERHIRHSLQITTGIRAKEASILSLKIDSILEIILSMTDFLNETKPTDDKQWIDPFSPNYVLP